MTCLNVYIIPSHGFEYANVLGAIVQNLLSDSREHASVQVEYGVAGSATPNLLENSDDR